MPTSQERECHTHASPESALLHDRPAIAAAVNAALRRQRIVDMHTHLYPASFGECHTDSAGLMLWGIDELLTYHYLVAELFRVVRRNELTPEQFFAMPKAVQAELVWRKLFIDRSPISEACRGVLTSLRALGLDTADRDLEAYRRWFAEQSPDEQIDRVMELAGVETITMTNDVFDDNERARWLRDRSSGSNPRFRPVLRVDPLVVGWPAAAPRLGEWGYGHGIEEIRRFLCDWIEIMRPVYIALSLPPTFRYPSDAPGVRNLTGAIVPVCREAGLPLALMIGVERGVNPALRQAGDMGFAADVASVVRLAVDHPDQRLLVTMLSRENQHELAVAARKCGNLVPFGCWWHLNTPSLVEEITRMRFELLGMCFIPQHSDCRVLEQLIYKWDHSRAVLAKVLTDKYAELIATGWPLTVAEVGRDVAMLLRENYLAIVQARRQGGKSI